MEMTSPAKNCPVAYLCDEFAIDSNLPIYAGGLGVLAADTLKEAADQGFPMVGVGLLYKGEHFVQKIDEGGWQQDENLEIDFKTSNLKEVKLKGNTLYVVTNLGGEDVWIKAYEKKISPSHSLYLLTTDCEYNSPEWRSIMNAIYSGSEETQLRQQLVLGIGAVKLLSALDIEPSIYHLNEGRPSFLVWQLAHQCACLNKITYEHALAIARGRCVYTNHTLVSSGNPEYDPALVKKYASSFVSELGVPTDALIAQGIDEETKRFSITKFALGSTRIACGVSEVHGKLASENWPDYRWTYVTNGVHLPTWSLKEMGQELSDELLWEKHLDAKNRLVEEVIKRTGFGYDVGRLVITWARRITDYKQLNNIFDEVSLISDVIKNSQRPIQLLVAGKSHWGDEGGKKEIQNVIKYMQNELSGNALFVPDYDLDLAKLMVSGSDVWLNTPIKEREASGTSGMKAAANGVLNLTVNAGWAEEVDWSGCGWIIDDQDLSAQISNALNQKIAPLYYNRSNGLPDEWIKMMKKSISLAKKYSTTRMLNEYKEKLYD